MDNKKELEKYAKQTLEFVYRIVSFDQFPVHVKPVQIGCTDEGAKINLGFLTFVAKILYMTGSWEKLEDEKKKKIINSIKNYQVSGKMEFDPVTRNAFIDPEQVKFLKKKPQNQKSLFRKLFANYPLNELQRVILAETKQSIATLKQVHASSDYNFDGFPATKATLKKMLDSQDWNKPWAAGGQASTFAVFLNARKNPLENYADLRTTYLAYMESLAKQDTGGYYQSERPEYGQLVNGAMKVLTGLAWFDAPIHYPEALIDTVLLSDPAPEGCHIVDAIYVLHFCSKQTNHRKKDIENYFNQSLKSIDKHWHSAGGFSYSVGQAQKMYYGLPISKGLNEPDLHGSVLLLWAVSLISDFFYPGKFFKLIKP